LRGSGCGGSEWNGENEQKSKFSHRWGPQSRAGECLGKYSPCSLADPAFCDERCPAHHSPTKESFARVTKLIEAERRAGSGR
jgi:hypothetical protein